MIKRLFIKLPLYVVWFILLITGIVPILYWVIYGRDFTEFMENITDL